MYIYFYLYNRENIMINFNKDNNDSFLENEILKSILEIRPTFDSFRKGAVKIGLVNKNISEILTDSQIRNDFINYMLGNKKHIKTQINLDNFQNDCFFNLYTPIVEIKEKDIKDNYNLKAYKYEDKNNILIFNEEGTKDILFLSNFVKDNISSKSLSFDTLNKNKKISGSLKTDVFFDINGTHFIGKLLINFNFIDITKSNIMIVNIFPCAEIFGYSFSSENKDLILLKGSLWNKDDNKTKEFLSVIKEVLSSIKKHNVENNIIQSIINSDIFDFNRNIKALERIHRISFVLRYAFKEPMFKINDDYNTLFIAYFIENKDIDYVKEIFSSNVEKHKKNLLSYINRNEIFGINNNIDLKDNFNEIIEHNTVKKYLSKNAIELIKTRKKNLYGKGEQYVKNVFNIPFGSYSQVDIDIKDIKKKLEENIYGMDNVKRKILNHLAVMARSPNATPPILCLSGPPGIGKTTICKIISEAINRSFDIISCSGMSESFSLIGSPYGYANPEFGCIIKSLIKCETMNPLILIDEIDKGSKGNHGSPEDALIPIFDPEQNYRFEDRYVGFPIDLSKVQFITTVNDLNILSEPLRDRMVVIEMNGYDNKEKLEIMKKFTIPKVMKNYKIKKDEVTITKEAMNQIVKECSSEAGMRMVEKIIKEVLAHSVYLIECGQYKIKIENIYDYIYINNNSSIGF